jgi:hypothetical protein
MEHDSITDVLEDATKHHAIENMSIDQLAGTVENYRTEIREKRRIIDLCEHQLMKIMTMTGGPDATGLPSANYTILMKRVSPSYDVNKLRASLGELLPPDEMSELIAEEYTKTEVVPEKVRGIKANSFKNRYGGDVADAINNSRVDMPRLTISLKE